MAGKEHYDQREGFTFENLPRSVSPRAHLSYSSVVPLPRSTGRGGCSCCVYCQEFTGASVHRKPVVGSLSIASVPIPCP